MDHGHQDLMQYSQKLIPVEAVLKAKYPVNQDKDARVHQALLGQVD
jgi:hypothetical protein